MDMMWWVIAVLMIIGFIWITVVKTISAHKEQIASGVEALIGKVGTAKTDISPKGKFYVYGEYWDAETLGVTINEGEKAKVVEIRSSDEQYLIVEKVE